MKHLYLLFFLFLFSCTEKIDPSEIAIIPKPVSLERSTGGAFLITPSTTYHYDDNNPELRKIGEMFSHKVASALGYPLKQGESKHEIFFRIDTSASDHKEGYRLEVMKNKITISAPTAAGIFYGTQTLFQLLPPPIKSKSVVTNATWSIPAVKIKDHPRMAWRGTMLDVARHFFTKEQVMEVIDQAAEYKLNRFHFHLADDQGWRVELKTLPALTQKTAYRPYRIGDWWKMDAPREDEPFDYGGFYTQDEIREIIAYAADRYVEVIPEIDVPGHSLALMTVYPELHCFGTSEFVNVGNEQEWEVSSLCIGNEQLMPILKTIFGEIATLFPSEYIHMGGDECGKELWKKCPKCQATIKKNALKDEFGLQSYFVKNMGEYIQSLGKKMIGWDEIMEGGLTTDAVVMNWRGMEEGAKAASLGYQVIMTPNRHCYLDLYKGDPAIEPRTYGRSRLRDSYEWNPVPDGVSEDLILGGQGNLWSETLTTLRQMQYCQYPNLWALAETFWTPQTERAWAEFFPRVENHFKRADYADINYAKSVYNAWIMPKRVDGKVYIDFMKELDDVTIYYTLDNTIPDHHSPKYDDKPFEMISNSSKINVQTYRNGKPCGNLFRVTREDIEKRAK